MLKKGDRFKAHSAVKNEVVSFNVVDVIEDCRNEEDFGTVIGRTSDGFYKSFPFDHYGYEYMVDVVHEAPVEAVVSGGPAPEAMREKLEFGAGGEVLPPPARSIAELDKRIEQEKFCTLVVCHDCKKRMPGSKDPSRIDHGWAMRKNKMVPVCRECE